MSPQTKSIITAPSAITAKLPTPNTQPAYNQQPHESGSRKTLRIGSGEACLRRGLRNGGFSRRTRRGGCADQHHSRSETPRWAGPNRWLGGGARAGSRRSHASRAESGLLVTQTSSTWRKGANPRRKSRQDLTTSSARDVNSSANSVTAVTITCAISTPNRSTVLVASPAGFASPLQAAIPQDVASQVPVSRTAMIRLIRRAAGRLNSRPIQY